MTKPAYSGRLASPTMAQIFMRQGHWRRARETLNALLAESPFAGQALALRDRIDALEAPNLHARAHGATIEVRWQRAAIGAHLVAVFFSGPSIYATSSRIEARDGRVQLPLSTTQERWRSGAVALSIVQLLDGRATPLAIADPVTFGDGAEA
ncbi:MAG: hypothetical protein IPK80_10675 [Nannocystis sp.]|nr:hypothetical protein [Nannocystis sp.]